MPLDAIFRVVHTLHEILYVIIPHRQVPSHSHLVHLPDELVDVVFSVTQVTSLDEVLELPRSESASWVAELERPQEVGGLLEVGTDGGNWPDM
jgi:hypothetical protein